MNIIDAAIIKYKWKHDDPYNYYITKSIDKHIKHLKEIENAPAPMKEASDTYRETFEIVYRGKIEISDKIVESLT
jgi:hypothetical protein